MLARKIIESLNVSPIYFIVAFNLSQNLSLIAGICIYDCKPIQVGGSPYLLVVGVPFLNIRNNFNVIKDP